jgi:P27 family predicted phage terminase small subunit
MGGGSRPLPTALKMLKGTHQSCRDAPGAPPANVPTQMLAPPLWLNYRAAEIFRQLAVHLTGMKILNVEDVAMLALLASRLEEVEDLTELIESEGRVYTSDKGLLKARPEVGMRNEAMRHAQSLLIEFGLSPAARSRVSASLPNTRENPIAILDQ